MSAATPMAHLDRLDAYHAQYPGAAFTPAQRRRIAHKANRANRAAAGRVLTPRQARWAEIRRVRAARKAEGR